VKSRGVGWRGGGGGRSGDSKRGSGREAGG